MTGVYGGIYGRNCCAFLSACRLRANAVKPPFFHIAVSVFIPQYQEPGRCHFVGASAFTVQVFRGLKGILSLILHSAQVEKSPFVAAHPHRRFFRFGRIFRFKINNFPEIGTICAVQILFHLLPIYDPPAFFQSLHCRFSSRQ